MAQVNLLLNRASPWLDIDSYLPYQGKVVIKNKTAREVRVRVPLWVDKRAIETKVNDAHVSPVWLGNYLVLEGLAAQDTVTIEFPAVETTEQYVNGWEGVKWSEHTEWTDPAIEGRLWYDKEHYQPPEELTLYTCHFKGNTLVDISPREEGAGYPIYLRDHYKQVQAPLKKVTRYVSPGIIAI